MLLKDYIVKVSRIHYGLTRRTQLKLHFKDLMVPSALPGTVRRAHVSGWMTTDGFYLFVIHFIKSTKCSNEQPVLLILDNHETHLSIKTIDLAKEKGFSC